MEAYLEGKPDEPHVQQEEQPQQGESHEGQLYSKPANYMEQLTQDVFGLAMLLAPLPEERALRALLIELVVDICEDLWSSKQVQVSVFGSSAIGVYLHGSDIDIVVSAPATDPSMVLWKLYAQLKNQNWVAPMSLNMISKARVPVIKLVSIPRLGRIKMDIVANVQTGHASTELMKTWVATYPTLMPLALIIKLMLKQKGFDEVFTGGVGGYALLNMIVAVIIRDQQTFNKEYSGNPDRYASPDSVHSLGRLIWLFFEFYARQLDYGLNAIHITDDPLANVVTVRPDMGYASARYPSFSGGNSSLHIIDPTETSNNVTRGSFRFGELRQLFEEVLTDLEWHQSTFDEHGQSGLNMSISTSSAIEADRDRTLMAWMQFDKFRNNLQAENGGPLPLFDLLNQWLLPSVNRPSASIERNNDSRHRAHKHKASGHQSSGQKNHADPLPMEASKSDSDSSHTKSRPRKRRDHKTHRSGKDGSKRKKQHAPKGKR